MTQRMRQHVGLLAAAVAGLCVGGCAFGTTKVVVGHGALASVATSRQGKILVKPFADRREPAERPYIGNKRNGFGMAFGRVAAAGAKSVPDLLTDCFAEALTQAGYTPIIEGRGKADPAAKYDAVLEGEIRRFWMDLYFMIWHNVEVGLTLKKAPGGQPLWTGTAHGERTRMLWLGIAPEFEGVISAALTRALDSAAAQFASDEFFQAVQKK
jgi:hypothetical protein